MHVQPERSVPQAGEGGLRESPVGGDGVTGALGVEPIWDEAPGWTGRILAGRAQGWGWAPTVDLGRALAEIDEGLRT